MTALVVAALLAVAPTAASEVPAASPSPATAAPIETLPPPVVEPTAEPSNSPGIAPSTLSAGTIFSKARLAMYLRTYPRYVAYIIDIQSEAYGRHYHEGFRAMLRTHDDALVVHRTPVYTSNQPPNPYGFSFFGINPEGKPSDHIDPPFGVPLMSATYDFDLARGPTPRHHSESSEQEPLPPVLGRVSVTGGDYDVTLIGEEQLDGADVFHLGLRPLQDPKRNRVRELWVDAATFDVRKLVTEGIFQDGPPSSVPWTVTFIQLHGYWFIRQETTTASLHAGGHLFSRGTVYAGVNYTFGRYEYPGYISDLEFTDFNLSTGAVQE